LSEERASTTLKGIEERGGGKKDIWMMDENVVLRCDADGRR
jgi:hypothetical protein